MLIYLAVIVLIIVFDQRLIRYPQEWRREIELKYARILGIIFVIIAALRASTVGTDTAGYISDYNLVHNMSYALVIQRFSDNPGYFFVSKFFADLGISVQIWFGLLELVYVIAIEKILKKEEIK